MLIRPFNINYPINIKLSIPVINVIILKLHAFVASHFETERQQIKSL